jgi:23S rRNA (adenine2503-C2)-methyltransferase
LSLPHLRGLLPDELARLAPRGLPARPARLAFRRLLQDGADDLEGIEGLSRGAAQALLERGRLDALEVVDRRSSAVDPFVKYLFRAPDGARFEAVRIPLRAPRWSACISSQAGCALACAFCETGRLGFERDLEAWEMVEQVRTIRVEGPERPLTGVVFQGQGEPLQNYEAVLRACEILRHPCGLQVAGERITISTAGLLPAIERYTDEGHPYRLILSLTSAFQSVREKLLPVARRWPVEDLAEAMRRHARRRNRGVASLAWVLIAGLNDGPEEAAELARLFRGVRVRLSVIDVNDPAGRFAPPDAAARGRFLDALRRHGIAFHRRYSGGPDVHAACGMLAGRTQGGEALAAR